MRYTAEEVREHAEFLHECMLNGINDPAPELRWKHQDKIAAMLTAYAALLERSEAGVTDEVARDVLRRYLDATNDDGDLADFVTGMRNALLAVWPVAAEPARPADSWRPGEVEHADEYKAKIRDMYREQYALGETIDQLKRELHAALAAHGQPAEPVAQGEAVCKFPDCECPTSGFDRNCQALGRVIGQDESTHTERARVPADVFALARRCLWLAYAWNDHNFERADIEARKEAQKWGINSFDEANDWLAAAAPQPGEPTQEPQSNG